MKRFLVARMSLKTWGRLLEQVSFLKSSADPENPQIAHPSADQLKCWRPVWLSSCIVRCWTATCSQARLSLLHNTDNHWRLWWSAEMPVWISWIKYISFVFYCELLFLLQNLMPLLSSLTSWVLCCLLKALWKDDMPPVATIHSDFPSSVGFTCL